MVHKPAHLGAREIRVKHQTRGAANLVERSLVRQVFARGRGTAVLPHNGAVSYCAVSSIKGHRCFALVGNAEGENVVAILLSPLRNFAQGINRELSNFVGVVLYFTRLRKILGEFSIRRIHERGRGVKGHRAHASRTGVESENEVHAPTLAKRSVADNLH